LEAANLYDIGCGSQLQALFLMYAPEINYTGIDPHIFEDYPDNFFPDLDYINELFKKLTGNGRIKYIKETYPCDLTAAENNIAVCGSVGSVRGAAGDESKKDTVAALARNFERIMLNVPESEYNLTGMNIRDIVYNEVEMLVNPFEKYYDLWKNAMPNFEFYRIGEPNFIFGTRISGDREKLEKNYTVIGDRILTGAVDVPWHRQLMVNA